MVRRSKVLNRIGGIERSSDPGRKLKYGRYDVPVILPSFHYCRVMGRPFFSRVCERISVAQLPEYPSTGT